ncbi:MAG TPA: dehydratase, partial [Porticoccaceae bacterium]|nr:dehydratase [Porticoccaceae bacterium]
IRAAKETSKPDRGVVTLAFTVTNQRAERVQDGEFTLMMRRRP